MISRVLGNIARVGVGDVVVVHGGIGFQVFVTPPFAVSSTKVMMLSSIPI